MSDLAASRGQSGVDGQRIPARLLLTQDQLADLRRRRPWKGIALIVHAWTVIFVSIALVAWFPNPVTFLLAVMLIGSRQLGLAILMHDGAHGCFAHDQRLNMTLSQWFCAWPVFADTKAYRSYHLLHHAHTQQPDDPDLVLSAPFPITWASYKRKFVRDITGQTGFQQRKAQVLSALGGPALPFAARARHVWRRLGPQCVANAVLFAGLAAAGVWWAYPSLWLLPLLTWMMVITRIRNIAEHAVVPDSNDPLRNTRTTKASLLERAFIAPYFVNYHLEHHLLFFVPCYNLPKLHDILTGGPYGSRMEIEHGYRAVMRRATAKPAAKDRPDAADMAARRRGGDRAAAGF